MLQFSLFTDFLSRALIESVDLRVGDFRLLQGCQGCSGIQGKGVIPGSGTSDRRYDIHTNKYKKEGIVTQDGTTLPRENEVRVWSNRDRTIFPPTIHDTLNVRASEGRLHQ
ncbi:hypothetical protein J6590_014460 [Homalodisca vitripennis]|nr:hypothetical protein J6590_014460 [Homalodisca vitripennis]